MEDLNRPNYNATSSFLKKYYVGKQKSHRQANVVKTKNAVW